MVVCDEDAGDDDEMDVFVFFDFERRVLLEDEGEGGFPFMSRFIVVVDVDAVLAIYGLTRRSPFLPFFSLDFRKPKNV